MLDILVCFSVPLLVWLVGFMILDPQAFARFFK